MEQNAGQRRQIQLQGRSFKVADERKANEQVKQFNVLVVA
jgi:hypothetical protein